MEPRFDISMVDYRSFDGKEKMHLYWMVRRVTPSMIEKEKKQKDNRYPIKGNMELQTFDFYHAMTSMMPDKKSMHHSVVVTAPFLTNTVDLKKGDVLTMEVRDGPVKEDGTKKQRVRTWETDAMSQAKKHQKQAGKHASGDVDDPTGGILSENGNFFI